MRAVVVVAVVAVAVAVGGVVLPAAATGGTFGLSDGGVVVGDAGPASQSPPVETTAAGPDGTDGDGTNADRQSADAGLAGVDRSDDGNVTPGQQLAGVVGVQGEEISSEVSERRFAVRFDVAASNRSKASVVAEEVETLRDRLDRLRAQRDELRTALRNGSIPPGEFRARMAVLSANVSSTQRMLNNSALAATSLSGAALAERGVSVSRIEDLRRNASEIEGPTAEIAREIAGPETGEETGDFPGDLGGWSLDFARVPAQVLDPAHADAALRECRPGQ